jgi:hypothetical protein
MDTKKTRSSQVVAAGVSSVGTSGFADPERPIHISGTGSHESIAAAVGRRVTVRVTVREAQWTGKALLRYGFTPPAYASDVMGAGHAWETAFSAELDSGIERAIAAGEEAAKEYRERIERRRVSVIEDRTDRGFDPEAYADEIVDRSDHGAGRSEPGFTPIDERAPITKGP